MEGKVVMVFVVHVGYPDLVMLSLALDRHAD